MKKGFTLIELLVVVSIIGVLATIVLSSLGEARDRAQDAKIKSSLRALTNQAELFYLDNNGYVGPGGGTGGYRRVDNGDTSSGGANSFCTLDPFIDRMFDSLSGITYLNCRAGFSSGTWGGIPRGPYYASGAVLSDGTQFCVDNTGFAGVPTRDILTWFTPACN